MLPPSHKSCRHHPIWLRDYECHLVILRFVAAAYAFRYLVSVFTSPPLLGRRFDWLSTLNLGIRSAYLISFLMLVGPAMSSLSDWETHKSKTVTPNLTLEGFPDFLRLRATETNYKRMMKAFRPALMPGFWSGMAATQNNKLTPERHLTLKVPLRNETVLRE